MKKFHTEQTEQYSSYRTGSTKPPKSHQGIIALLLALVIFLGGTVSALGLLNIRLFRMIKTQQAADRSSVRFSADPQTASAQSLPDGQVEDEQLGIYGQTVSDVYRCYNGWPQGVYISDVTPGSPADTAKLVAGDILLSINGETVANEQDFYELFGDLTKGRVYAVTVYRDGRRITLPLSLGV